MKGGKCFSCSFHTGKFLLFMLSEVITLKKIIQVIFNLGWHLAEIIGIAVFQHLDLVVILAQNS